MFRKTRNEDPPTREIGVTANQLTSASRSALGWQFSRHGLAGNSYFPCGRIFISCFLNPWASILKFWIVFCFGNHFLFKSVLEGCDMVYQGIYVMLVLSKMGAIHSCLLGLFILCTYLVDYLLNLEQDWKGNFMKNRCTWWCFGIFLFILFIKLSSRVCTYWLFWFQIDM